MFTGPIVNQGGELEVLGTHESSTLYAYNVPTPILAALPCPHYPHADCDVYFRLHMKLVDWGSPLPTAIGMG